MIHSQSMRDVGAVNFPPATRLAIAAGDGGSRTRLSRPRRRGRNGKNRPKPLFGSLSSEGK